MPLILSLGLALAGCDQFAVVGLSEAGSFAPPAVDDPADAGGDLPRRVDADVTGQDAAMVADAATDLAAASDATSPECVSPPVAFCDPVLNTICDPILVQRCAIDFVAQQLAGYCVFMAPTAVQGACLDTGLTEDCPPTYECIDGQCRKACFCDSQCEDGQRCSEPVGAYGFKLCAAP